jgi:hypothetical protein
MPNTARGAQRVTYFTYICDFLEFRGALRRLHPILISGLRLRPLHRDFLNRCRQEPEYGRRDSRRNRKRRSLNDSAHASVRSSEPPGALASAPKASARLNRNKTRVATALLGSVIFAAVMVTVRVQRSCITFFKVAGFELFDFDCTWLVFT